MTSRAAAQPPKKAAGGIIVVGMHRSGTSCLTGLMEEAGVYLGGVSKWNPHNLRGNQEHPEVVALNDAVLVANGASWDVPPFGVCCWSDEHRARRDALFREYRAHARWAFKDPRTLLTLEGWLEAEPCVSLIATFRHPLAVARSLQRRGGGELSRWLDLWALYNRRLLRVLDARPSPVVCFDSAPGEYFLQVRRAFARVGLPAPAEFAFFDPGLRTSHTHPGHEPLPDSCADLYAALIARLDF